MRFRLALLCALALLLMGAASPIMESPDGGSNIYRIYVRSRADAQALWGLGLNAFLRVPDGYLVQTTADKEKDMAACGVEYELIATGIIRDHLALDMRRDGKNADRYPILYEDGNIRLFHIAPADRDRSAEWQGLSPILSDNLKIIYWEPPSLDLSKTRDMLDLDSLAGAVILDSCESYIERLQAFQTRWSGTDSCLASRDWLMAKFGEFGYDSVFCDTFMSNHTYGGWDLVEAHNVIAVKTGTVYPDHQIVLGAHRDTYPIESPGADDNASGSAAVLEIARILSGIDSRMTFVFVLFDTEETGLFGSWNYANRAALRGDSIVLMINMDVIGYYANTDTVGAQCSWDSPYGELWAHLADSLPSIGLTAIDLGAPFADGQPFDVNGYNTIEAFEWKFNIYMHGPHDSTTYLSYDYITRITRASLATAYLVDNTYVPDPQLKLSFPGGLPEFLVPNTPTTFDVVIETYAGAAMLPGSGQLHYRLDDSPYETAPLVEIGGGLFQATLPACPCDSRVDFYVSVQETGGNTFVSASAAEPHMAATGIDMTVLAEYDFEQHTFWTVYGDADEGAWNRYPPHGYGSNAEVPIDFDGSGMCYLTGPEPIPWNYSHTDVDGGTTTLRSPAIDMSDGQVLLQYARWYSNHYGYHPYSDVFQVFISNDNGLTWTPVETVGPVEQASGAWFLHRCWVNDIIEPTAQMRLRFDASDLGSDSNIEAAVDAVRIVRFTCGPDPEIVTEDIPDWTVGIPYSAQLEAVNGYGTINWTDEFDDLSGTGLALSPAGEVAGTPVDQGTISFTAAVVDELERVAERSFSFVINPEPAIITETIPDGKLGVSMSIQLEATGGTGAGTWSDVDGSLSGTGLGLSATGLLSGTPSDTGTIGFTARVEDIVGAGDEKQYGFHIGPLFVCGDANGDGTADVADAVFIINFVFKKGPAPEPIEAGDANGDGDTNVGDAVYIINYVFKNGPAPEC